MFLSGLVIDFFFQKGSIIFLIPNDKSSASASWDGDHYSWKCFEGLSNMEKMVVVYHIHVCLLSIKRVS